VTVSVYRGAPPAIVEVIDTAQPVPPQNPVITGFTATPSTIAPGGSVVLNATVTNATSLALDGVAIAGLPQTVTPTSSRTFTLTATGAAGTTPATASTAVTVSSPVPAPVFVRRQVDLARVVAFDRQLMAGSRYERFQKHTSINSTTTVHKINCDNQAGGGAPVPFSYPRYGVQFAPLLPDNSLGAFVERGTFSLAPGTTTTTTVTITLGGTESDGHYQSRFVAYDAAGAVVANPVETLMEYWIVIDRNGTAKNDPRVVIQSGNFDWTHYPAPAPGKGWYSYCILPKTAVVPSARPLPKRDAVTPFSTTLSPTAMARVSLLPAPDTIDQNPHYPCVTDRGVTVCDNMQGYEPSHMFSKFPILPLVPGARGVCSFPFTLGGSGGRNGKFYGVTPWSIYVMDATGTGRTMAGLEHAGAPTYWETPVTSVADPRIRVVGFWDPNIPPAERYPREAWGIAWDARSLLLDTTAPPIGGEQPHLPYTTTTGQLVDGPRYFFVDSLGRLVEGQTSGTDRAAPHRFTVRMSGLGDSWDCATKGRSIYISIRDGHKIIEVSMDTYAKVRDVVFDATGFSLGVVGTQPRRWTWSGGYPAGRDACRAAKIVAPEGLDVISTTNAVGVVDDSDLWLYWGSMAQAQVRRVNLTTGAVEVVANVPLSVGGGVDSYYVQIAVSDGSYGPRGSVATTTFYNDNLGKPTFFRPDGTVWDYQGVAGGNYTQGIDCGAGGHWNGSHYSTAVAIKEGRLFCADSSGAVNYFCKADAYDVVIDAAKGKAGWQKWLELGFSVQHGPYAVNRSGPLPFGVDANLDYWMTNVLRIAA
jgi:hypothetical protein